MFNTQGTCGGKLSTRTYAQTESILDNLSTSQYQKLPAAAAALAGSTTLTAAKVKSILKYAFKTAYDGCDATTCKACGTSFYAFDPSISSQPSLGNPSSLSTATCAMADATTRSNNDYTCGGGVG